MMHRHPLSSANYHPAQPQWHQGGGSLSESNDLHKAFLFTSSNGYCPEDRMSILVKTGGTQTSKHAINETIYSQIPT
jgi:hypothetical protein